MLNVSHNLSSKSLEFRFSAAKKKITCRWSSGKKAGPDQQDMVFTYSLKILKIVRTGRQRRTPLGPRCIETSQRARDALPGAFLRRQLLMCRPARGAQKVERIEGILGRFFGEKKLKPLNNRITYSGLRRSHTRRR